REQVRTQQTNLGDLTADANLAEAKKADESVVISLKNGGGIRAAIGVIIDLGNGQSELAPPPANPALGKQRGDVSQLDVVNTLKFNNGLTLLTLTIDQLKAVLEHAFAETEPGATPGRFPQLGGIKVFVDLDNAPGNRVTDAFLIDEAGNEGLRLFEAGEDVSGLESVRIVTLDFLAGGGDGYPFPGDDAANVVQLEDVLSEPGLATFADPGSEQDAFAEFMLANHSITPYSRAEQPVEEDDRIIFGAPLVAGGEARIQIIHDAPTETVQVSVNGEVLIPFLAYRTATPYFTVPAGVPLEVEVKPTSPFSAAAPINATVSFVNGETYIIAARGTWDASDSFDTGLSVFAGASETTAADEVAVQFFHGTPDAPTVDIATGGNVLFDDVSYTEFGDDQISVPAAVYLLDLNVSADNSTIATYRADLSFWKGRSLTIFASGLLDDGGDGNLSFQPWVALSNGGTFPLFPVQARPAGLREGEVDNQLIQETAMTVYPNPATDKAMLELELMEEENVSVLLYNTNGQAVREVASGLHRSGLHKFELTLNDLPKGIYYIRTTTATGHYVKPLVIQ
ncbi:MAG: DUF4397 domain-containing protein, partial [Bacteroidota bacterium]